MTRIAAMAASESRTLRLMCHLRATEKLGRVTAWLDMLLPAAAFHHFPRQEQKENRQAEVENDIPGVQNAPNEFLHVNHQRNLVQQGGLPAGMWRDDQ